MRNVKHGEVTQSETTEPGLKSRSWDRWVPTPLLRYSHQPHYCQFTGLLVLRAWLEICHTQTPFFRLQGDAAGRDINFSFCNREEQI